MPALHAIAQQLALHEVQAALREGEAIFAYSDDTYIVAAPDLVAPPGAARSRRFGCSYWQRSVRPATAAAQA